MTEATQSDTLNQIDSLSTLQIKAVSENTHPQIYANGLNRLPIQITVKALNKNGTPLTFSKSDWINMISLCFAENDTKLNRKVKSGWCFTEEKNDYSKEIQAGSHRRKRFTTREDGTAIIIMYVYTDDINTKRIAVSVDTDQGKHFTTADSALPSQQYSVNIKAILAINYADKSNLSISVGSFVEVSSNLGWTSKEPTRIANFYSKNYNGTCQKREIKIYLKNEGLKFTSKTINYQAIKNTDVNKGTVQWKNENENGFDIIQDSDYCAVIGSDASKDGYHINFWFADKKNIHIDGHFYLKDMPRYYRFCPYVKENEKDLDKDVITFLLYKFILPKNEGLFQYDVDQYGWYNVIRNPTVNVTDFYGNTGTFQLTFNDTDHFDNPGIV